MHEARKNYGVLAFCDWTPKQHFHPRLTLRVLSLGLSCCTLNSWYVAVPIWKWYLEDWWKWKGSVGFPFRAWPHQSWQCVLHGCWEPACNFTGPSRHWEKSVFNNSATQSDPMSTPHTSSPSHEVIAQLLHTLRTIPAMCGFKCHYRTGNKACCLATTLNCYENIEAV